MKSCLLHQKEVVLHLHHSCKLATHRHLLFSPHHHRNKDKFFQIGAIVPVTAAGSVHVSYGQNKDDGWKDQAFTVAYNHNLSKRTGVYAGVTYAKEKIDGVGSDSANTFVVGARHAF